jgi:glutamine amidotransferase
VSPSGTVIIDSGGANLASLQFALQRLGAESVVSRDAAVIAAATRVLLPGVGAAANAMARLRGDGLQEVIPALRQPLLGICLGMQLLYESSAEGDCQTLGLLPGRVAQLQASEQLPVPHMGWNTCQLLAADPLLDGIAAGDRFYFVHSYAARASSDTIAVTGYGSTFAAVVRRDNFWGVQFHPERSAGPGARLLRNFLQLS